MASTYDLEKKQTTTTTTTPATNTSGSTATTQAATVTPYTGLQGLSSQTSSALGKYSQGYQASDTVNQAQNYLNNVVAGKPADYQSQYKQQLDDLYNQVMNRPKFQYDLNGDMLYQQYKDQYMTQGKQAMQDTMSQAAALTGGYGNSYANTAGNQAYQGYLQQLNAMVPELYQMALNQYTQEGQDLQNRYNLTSDLEDKAYGKYRDTVSDWQNEREFANTDYWNKYNADYSDFQNMLNYWNQLAQQENSAFNTNKQMAYNQAMAVLQTGTIPSAALLNSAGISAADASALAKYYKKKGSSGGGGGGGGGSRRSSGSGSSKSSSGGGLSGYAAALDSDMKTDKSYNSDTKADIIDSSYKSGLITKKERDTLRKNAGV